MASYSDSNSCLRQVLFLNYAVKLCKTTRHTAKENRRATTASVIIRVTSDHMWDQSQTICKSSGSSTSARVCKTETRYLQPGCKPLHSLPGHCVLSCKWKPCQSHTRLARSTPHSSSRDPSQQSTRKKHHCVRTPDNCLVARPQSWTYQY